MSDVFGSCCLLPYSRRRPCILICMMRMLKKDDDDDYDDDYDRDRARRYDRTRYVKSSSVG